jgi:hypothetical protein
VGIDVHTPPPESPASEDEAYALLGILLVALPTWNSLVAVAKASCYTIENLFSLSSTTLKAKKSALHLAAVSGASCVLRYLLERKP